MPVVVFPEELIHRLKNFIASRSGLYFQDHDLKNLQDVVLERMKACNFDAVLSYYTYLTASENKEDELRELLNLLTINHTYFFRNEAQFKVFKEKLLPEIINRKNAQRTTHGASVKPTLRIWSAGCSTGEEPYSIAMIVQDAIPNLEEWDIQIIATDASTEALERARRGVYQKNSVKSVDQEHLDRYFTIEIDSQRNTHYGVCSTIKDMVTFGFHNLMDDDFPMDFDIIFCRNVVIYFEFETTLKIMSKFYSSLNNDGYLFIGYSESLHFMQDKFKMLAWEDAIYYRKTSLAGAVALEGADAILEEISRAEVLAEMEAEAKKISPPSKKMEEVLTQAIKCFHLKQYQQALEFIDQAILIDAKAVDPYYLAAQVYVNQGRFGEARQRIDKLLALDSLFAAAHYLSGCIYTEEGSLEKAKESFKKALYIDKDFSLVYFHLANIYKNEGKINDAIREYRNTLKILSKSASSDIIAYSGGFEVATLMNVCRDNIERLKLEQWT